MNESTLVPREEMSDLDWLARNVHVWPTSTPHIVPAGDSVFEFGVTFFENHACVYHREHADSEIIHKQQWLSRRAELQNKPSFADHPDAKCFVQNQCGYWWKNTETSNVIHFGDYWRVSDSVTLNCVATAWVEILGKGEVIGDWRDTLEKRPADLSEQAVTARLKEATENVLASTPELMADKYKFEPFISVEDASTAKQSAPKGSGKPILGMVLADLTNRALEGKEKYGEPLLAHNGRNPLWDAYQEALDLAMYLRQAIEEQK